MQKITVRQMTLPDEKESIAARILQSLPEWFGIPESTAQYIRDSRSLPFFASFDGQGEPDGFIVLKETGPRTCEICVMGVRPDCPPPRDRHSPLGSLPPVRGGGGLSLCPGQDGADGPVCLL